MSLYFILLICSISIPLVLSFDKKLQFYKQWKYVFPSIILVAVFYIVKDIYLTKIEVWGFNLHYHSSYYIMGLPFEEYLFFVVIPYASIFLHEAFILYYPDIKLDIRMSKRISAVLIIGLILLILLNPGKIYSVYAFLLVIISLVLSFFDKSQVISRFYITFLLILVPFFIVNGFLTGSFIDGEVVWYNNNENLGIRLLTIPVEDFAYGFSLILFNLLVIGKLKRSSNNYQLT